MGSSKVNVRQALAVFQKILDHGERIDDDYVLSGLRANQGFQPPSLMITCASTSNFINVLPLNTVMKKKNAHFWRS